MNICFEVDWKNRQVCFTEPQPHWKLWFHVICGDKIFLMEGNMAEVTMKVTEQQEVRIAGIFDDFGNPAAIEGIPVWSSGDAAKLRVVAAADGMSAIFSGIGPMGDAQGLAVGDADLTAGVSEITGRITFHLLAGTATVIDLEPVGAPQPQ